MRFSIKKYIIYKFNLVFMTNDLKKWFTKLLLVIVLCTLDRSVSDHDVSALKSRRIALIKYFFV